MTMQQTCAHLSICTHTHARAHTTSVPTYAHAHAGREPALRDQYDLAVARAVAELRVLAELCLPLVRTGGHWVAAKGAAPQDEVAGAKTAVIKVGGKLLGLEEVDSGGWVRLLGGCRACVCMTSPAMPRVTATTAPAACSCPACLRLLRLPALFASFPVVPHVFPVLRACTICLLLCLPPCRGPRGAAHRCACAQGVPHPAPVPQRAWCAGQEAAVLKGGGARRSCLRLQLRHYPARVDPAVCRMHASTVCACERFCVSCSSTFYSCYLLLST
jgi:hypothetical protein